MLLRMRLLDVTLRNLLHHEVGVDVHFLAQQAVLNTPLAGDGKDANGGLGVDEGVDAGGGVGELEGVCCLKRGELVGGIFIGCWEGKGGKVDDLG